MSQENVEILRAFYEAFNTRRVDEALQYVDQNVELHPGVIAPDSDAMSVGRGCGSSFRGSPPDPGRRWPWIRNR